LEGKYSGIFEISAQCCDWCCDNINVATTNPLTTNRRFSDGHFCRFLTIFSSGLAELIFMKLSEIVHLINLNKYCKNEISNINIYHFIASIVTSLKKFFLFAVQKNAKNALKNAKNSFFTLIHRRNPL